MYDWHVRPGWLVVEHIADSSKHGALAIVRGASAHEAIRPGDIIAYADDADDPWAIRVESVIAVCPEDQRAELLGRLGVTL